MFMGCRFRVQDLGLGFRVWGVWYGYLRVGLKLSKLFGDKFWEQKLFKARLMMLFFLHKCCIGLIVSRASCILRNSKLMQCRIGFHGRRILDSVDEGLNIYEQVIQVHSLLDSVFDIYGISLRLRA